MLSYYQDEEVLPANFLEQLGRLSDKLIVLAPFNVYALKQEILSVYSDANPARFGLNAKIERDRTCESWSRYRDADLTSP